MRPIDHLRNSMLLLVVALSAAAAYGQYRELPRFEPPLRLEPFKLPELPKPLELPAVPPPPPELRRLEMPPVQVCHDEWSKWTDANGVQHWQIVKKCD